MSEIHQKIGVAVAGATGVVGQKAITLIEKSPKFYVNEVAASSRSQGKQYQDVVTWVDDHPLEPKIASMVVKDPKEIKSQYIISALPSKEAMEIETMLLDQGKILFSNASAYRMQPDVPILIPEVNKSHLSLLSHQKKEGKIITNSNCVVAFVCLALAPLVELQKIDSVSLVTLQAISGAGVSGLHSFAIQGNVIPFIEKEEEKIVEETKKILGKPFEPETFPIEPQVFRVPILHGHTISLHVTFRSPVKLEDIWEVYRRREKNDPQSYKIWQNKAYPQPARVLSLLDQRAHIGQIKQRNEKNKIGLVVTGHNLVRGAAGASLRNLEAYLQYKEGI